MGIWGKGQGAWRDDGEGCRLTSSPDFRARIDLPGDRSSRCSARISDAVAASCDVSVVETLPGSALAACRAIAALAAIWAGVACR